MNLLKKESLTLQLKNKMISGEALIYERADGVVYAKYRDAPHNQIPRWIIGGDPAGVARAQGDLISYGEWQELCQLSEEYPTLKKLLDTLVTTYYTIKEHK
jgi:hypothetical protein